MTHDFELPGGFQDADFEMRDLQESANRAARLRKKGICDHSWIGPSVPGGSPSGPYVCHHCKQIFANEAALRASQDEAKEAML